MIVPLPREVANKLGPLKPNGDQWFAKCFSGETEYLTREGVRTLAETVGTVQKVLVGDGSWASATIRSFGVQRLWEIRLRRFNEFKTIYATAEHRWFRWYGRSGKFFPRGMVECNSSQLKPGDRLVSQFPEQRAALRFGVRPVQEAVGGPLPEPLTSYGFFGYPSANWLSFIPDLCRRIRNFGRRIGEWQVISVKESDREEEVFCATVPQHGNFTLTGNILTGNCPAHADGTPSLAVKADGASKRVLLRCHAGCNTIDILRAADLTWADLAGDEARKEHSPDDTWAPDGGTVVATYSYRDKDGVEIYQVVRLRTANGKKDFRQRRPHPERPGAWKWDMKGIRRVIYRLPQVLEALDKGEEIVFCYSPDTEVLTTQGWRMISDIVQDRPGLPVAQWNADTGEITFAIPSAYHQYSYTGDMLHLQGEFIDLMVTPDHRQARRMHADAPMEVVPAWRLGKDLLPVSGTTSPPHSAPPPPLLSFVAQQDLIEVELLTGTHEYRDKETAEQAQTWAVLNGYAARQEESERGWQVTVETNPWQQVGDISFVPYCGEVYCLTVPTGHLLTRRSDKMVISGNCEGEKDSNTSQANGRVGTTLPNGAQYLEPEALNVFGQGDRVLVVADADKTGQHHARMVKEYLEKRGTQVRYAEPQRSCKDLTDHFEAGYGWDDLQVLDEQPPPDLGVVDVWDLIGEKEAPNDWVIPGLLERAERFMLTGSEGSGKTSWLRQLAVQAAAGIHPTDGEFVPPVRVLWIDAENSRKQNRRAFNGLIMHTVALERDIGDNMLQFAFRPEGLNLAKEDDQMWLLERALFYKPDLLVLGPWYRLFVGNPSDEEMARHTVSVIDQVRVRVGCAVMIEAHSPHGEFGNTGGARPVRPLGSSLLLRWPEFGFGLSFDAACKGKYGLADFQHAEFVAWRGARDERDWPEAWERTGGGGWLWRPTASNVGYEALAAEIHANGNGNGSTRGGSWRDSEGIVAGSNGNGKVPAQVVRQMATG